MMSKSNQHTSHYNGSSDKNNLSSAKRRTIPTPKVFLTLLLPPPLTLFIFVIHLCTHLSHPPRSSCHSVYFGNNIFLPHGCLLSSFIVLSYPFT
uniref:Uncharacterized protein n=1 Tax=Octopus bimaculoides TaxID=37653 RepID=A0A0L8HDQ8_OCTBM